MNRRYVLKNRGRFHAFILMAVIVLMSVSLAVTANGADEREKTITVVVGKGDTLWDIAKKYGGGTNLRGYIREIKEANGLADGLIHEGDILALPVRY